MSKCESCFVHFGNLRHEVLQFFSLYYDGSFMVVLSLYCAKETNTITSLHTKSFNTLFRNSVLWLEWYVYHLNKCTIALWLSWMCFWAAQLTAAGFVVSVGAVWGEVTDFVFLDAFSTSTGKPRGRASGRKQGRAPCRRNKNGQINNIWLEFKHWLSVANQI